MYINKSISYMIKGRIVWIDDSGFGVARKVVNNNGKLSVETMQYYKKEEIDYIQIGRMINWRYVSIAAIMIGIGLIMMWCGFDVRNDGIKITNVKGGGMGVLSLVFGLLMGSVSFESGAVFHMGKVSYYWFCDPGDNKQEDFEKVRGWANGSGLIIKGTSGQQVDSAEASTNAVPPSDPSGSPR